MIAKITILKSLEGSKRVLLILILLNFGYLLFADNQPNESTFSGTIKGKVFSEKGNEPIEYANIVVYDLPDSNLLTGAISNSDGSFLISGLKAGKYYLAINFIGFYKKHISEIELSVERKILDIGIVKLTEAAEDLAEVEIVDERNPIQYHIDKKVVNVSKKLDAAGGSVANALENTPSIQVDMEGNVSLRGSSNFTVLVDGKPTALSGSDALKQIPASMVENVEIITNPSAKYDPEGTSGIINIVMKKNLKKSTSGIINLTTGTYDKYSADFNLNRFSKKINIFLSGSYSLNYSFPYSVLEGYKFLSDSTYYNSQHINRKQLYKPYSLGAGIDWYPNKSNSFTFKYDFGYWGMMLEMNSTAYESVNVNITETYSKSLSTMNIGGYYHSGTITHDLKFDSIGQSLITSIIFSKWDGGTTTDVDEQLTDNRYLNPVFLDNHILERGNINTNIVIKSDYTKPLKHQAKLELGFQGTCLVQTSQLGYQDFDNSTQSWFRPAGSSQSMDLNQTIEAAYITYSGIYKKFQFLAGLRAEYFTRKIEIKEIDMIYNLTQPSLFPTLHISRQLTEKQQLQLSYSRRVNRPQEWELYPFPIYSDNYVSQIGNPYLKPEFTDSYELNILHRFKKGFISLEGFYRQTNDAFNRTLTLDSTGIVLIGTQNLDKNFAYGFELTSNLNLYSWVSLYASANLYSYNVQGDDVSSLIEKQTLNSDFVLNTTFKLKKNFRIQLIGFYNSPKLTSQGYQYQMYGANLSLSKDFWNNKLNIVLSVRDIFHSMNFGFSTETQSIKSEFVYISEYPVITLRASFKINDYKRRTNESSEGGGFQGGGIM